MTTASPGFSLVLMPNSMIPHLDRQLAEVGLTVNVYDDGEDSDRIMFTVVPSSAALRPIVDHDHRLAVLMVASLAFATGLIVVAIYVKSLDLAAAAICGVLYMALIWLGGRTQRKRRRAVLAMLESKGY